MENSNNVENLNRKEEKGLVIKDLNEMPMTNNPNMITSNFYTNIKDKKQLFNLEQNVDFLLNDCENKEIIVKRVIIKVYVKEMKNPITDEETGEILKDTETTMSIVLVDDKGKSYATGSKIFGVSLMRYIRIFGMEEFENGVKMKIIKQKMNEGKALSFEVL